MIRVSASGFMGCILAIGALLFCVAVGTVLMVVIYQVSMYTLYVIQAIGGNWLIP